MKTINKLFLSIILLTSFVGVQAMDNEDNNQQNTPDTEYSYEVKKITSKFKALNHDFWTLVDHIKEELNTNQEKYPNIHKKFSSLKSANTQNQNNNNQ